MTLRPNVSVITLGVRDLDRAVAFYRDVLGWPTGHTEGEDVAFFDLSGTVLGLWDHDALADDARAPGGAPGFRGVALAHNVGSRAEVDAVFAMLAAAEATVTKPPAQTFWGGYAGYFADPDGHLWEVAHNPFWTIDAAGRIRMAPPGAS